MRLKLYKSRDSDKLFDFPVLGAYAMEEIIMDGVKTITESDEKELMIGMSGGKDYIVLKGRVLIFDEAISEYHIASVSSVAYAMLESVSR